MEEKNQATIKPDEPETRAAGHGWSSLGQFLPKKSWQKRLIGMVLATLLWLALVQYLAADKYSVAVQVGEASTQSGSAANIDFGTLASGGSAARFITLSAQGDKGIYVWAFKSGSAARLLKIDPDSFYLAPGQTKKLELTLEAPSSSTNKEYRGQVVIFKFPRIF